MSDTETLTFDNPYRGVRYRNLSNTEAWLEYDPQEDTFFLDVRSDGMWSMDVHHGVVLRWSVPVEINGNTLARTVARLRPDFAAIRAGHTTEWDGNSTVGTLTPAAEAAAERVREQLSSLERDVEVWSPWDFFQDAPPTVTAETDLEALAEREAESALRHGVVLEERDLIDYLEERQDEANEDDEDEA
jgi:hypothetical protein